jgi:hypothetical protein
MDYLNQLEKILESKYRLMCIESYDTERVLDLFLQLSRFSNKAFYLGTPNEGMSRIGASHITIPRTQTVKEQLDHIESSKHYGVFIIRDIGEELENNKNINILKNIATGDTPKVVILLSEYLDVPRQLKPYILRSKHQLKESA